jgi:gamma-glutamyl-gamma-aminobutyrate hydrolase PuuD
MNEIDLYFSANQKRIPLCGICDGDDLLICCEELPAEPNVPSSFRGITHAFAIQSDVPMGWIVAGPMDTIAFHNTGTNHFVTRALDWLEKSTGQHRTRDFDTMAKLVEAIDQLEINFSVSDVSEDDLENGLPDFDHYCCACRKTVPIRWKMVGADYKN